MIEAVNSVLASAPLVRQAAEVQSGASTNLSQTESVRTVTPPPYLSTFISVDVNFDTAVILLRDADTGDTVRQIPSEGALEARQRDQVERQNSQQSLVAPQVEGDALAQDASTSVDSGESGAVPLNSSGDAGVSTSSSSSAPISQVALAAFASGAQAASAGSNTSFATSA